MGNEFASPAIAKELQSRFGSSTKVVKIRIRHEAAVRKYIMGIEAAHKKAAKSKLAFR